MTMTDDEKMAMKRRTGPMLQALLHIKQYENEFMKIIIEVTKGGFDEVDLYSRLVEAKNKMELDTDRDHAMILNLLWHESTTVGRTDRDFEMWKRQMRIKRVNRTTIED